MNSSSRFADIARKITNRPGISRNVGNRPGNSLKIKKKPGWDRSKWVGLSPNGLGQQKPNHFGEMLKTVVENRKDLPYAFRILNNGTCDGCALGTYGMRDWTIQGIHLCSVRLNLLKLNTMGPLDISQLKSIKKLRSMSAKELREMGRIPYPMRRLAGEESFTQISWEQALGEIAQQIHISEPDQSCLYMTSRGISNEVYYAAQKAWRSFGSANIDNAARICHSPSTAALKETIGVGATTCSYSDLMKSDLVVLFGSDIANNQPVMMKYLYLAQRNNNTRVVVINPYREPGLERYWVPSNLESALFGTKFAQDFFQVSTGGDIAFIYGVLKAMIEDGSLRTDWIEERTEGFEEVRTFASNLDWSTIATFSGVSQSECRKFAKIYAQSERSILVWSMGITQHSFGADNVRAIVNLALARGNVGRPGCGLMPIRGHSGVQGGAEMGAYSNALPGGIALNPESARQLSQVYGFDVPDKQGLMATQMLERARSGQVRLLYCVGSNFVDVLPDPHQVESDLSRVDVRVHQDIVLTSQMFIDPKKAVYLLPARTRYEQEGGATETSTERRVIFSPEIPGRRIGEAKSEWRIFSDLAQVVHGDSRASFESGQQIRDEISQVVPLYKGIEKLEKSGDSIQWGGPQLCSNRFETRSGKARFSCVNLVDASIPHGKYRLSTRRGKQFNSIVHDESDSLTGGFRDSLFVSFEDALRLGVSDGSQIRVTSPQGSFLARVKLSKISPGNVAMYWPESNILIATGDIDPEGGVPNYNCLVELTPSNFEEESK